MEELNKFKEAWKEVFERWIIAQEFAIQNASNPNDAARIGPASYANGLKDAADIVAKYINEKG